MNYKIYLLILAACVLQTFVFSRHVKLINSHFSKLNKKGNVLVGKKTNFFKGGSIVMMVVSSEGIVEETYFIQGRTSFAKPKVVKDFNGLIIDDIDVDKYDFLNDLSKDAFKDAKLYFKRDKNKLTLDC